MPSDVAVSAFPFPSPENRETKPVEPVLLRVSKKPAAMIARFYKPYPFFLPRPRNKCCPRRKEGHAALFREGKIKCIGQVRGQTEEGRKEGREGGGKEAGDKTD